MPSERKPGRPKVTDKRDVVSLLVSSFRDGLSVRQACIQSGISHEAYYRRCRQDEDFADKMYYAQQTVLTAARKNVIKAIKGGDLRASQWWLEKHDFAKQAEEPPPVAVVAQPDPIKGKALMDSIRKYEAEVLGLQREYPHGVYEP
jgi:transposase